MNITKQHLTTLSVLLAFACSPNLATAAKNNIDNVNFAGTFLSTRMDVAGAGGPDASPAGWYTLQVSAKKHKQTSVLTGIVEDIPMGATEQCPGGLFIIDADNGEGGGSGTRSFINGKDQIYTIHTKRKLCADAFGHMSGIDQGLIVGGTGKYKDVSGTWLLEHTGLIQYSDFAAQPIQYFGSIIGKGEWVIHYPND